MKNVKRGDGARATMHERRGIAGVLLNMAGWVLLLGGLWLLLSAASGGLAGTVLVLGGAALATGLGVALKPLRWRVLPSFCLFFLRELFSGAIDVAARALLPRRTVSPGWVSYPLQEAPPAQHLWLSLIVGLFPGTLASHVEHDVLHLHVLDVHRPWRPGLEQLEVYLHRLAGNPA